MLLRNQHSSTEIQPRTDEEALLFSFFQLCVVLVPTQLEICGSFGLNMFQRFHEQSLKTPVPTWNYGDVDIFCCGGTIPNPNGNGNEITLDYDQVIEDFEARLQRHHYVIKKKLVKRFEARSTKTTGNKMLSTFRNLRRALCTKQ